MSTDTAPYGYQRDPEAPAFYLKDWREQTIIRLVVAARQIDRMGLREIARMLDDAGRKPRAGGAWHYTQIRRILDRAGIV